MKINKKTIIIIAIIISVLVVGVGFYFYLREQKRANMNITFVQETMTLEYGSEVDSKEFVKDSQGQIVIYPQVDTKKIGKQELTYVVEENNLKKDITYAIEIVDTKVPTIAFTQEKVEVVKQSDFDAKSYIKEVVDPVDGALPYHEDTIEKNGYTIDCNVDTSQLGTYQIHVVAFDVNGNKTEATLEVTVVEEQSQTTGGEETPSTGIQPTYIKGILLVNKDYGLPEDFGGLDETASSALSKLQDGAANAGFHMPLLSGYRSYAYQVNLYNNYVARDGQAAADRYSARPGYSEHQTGLCFDIGDIDNDYGETAAGKWLASHAHEYGFIIRFPDGKESITGYMYEPWHVRYVGNQVANAIYSQGITLEEYLGVR